MAETTGKILLATDFGEQSLRALDYAKHFAKLSGSEIVLMHVMEETSLIHKMFSSDEDAVKVNQQAKKLLDQLVEQAKDTCKITSLIEYGKPYDKIIDVAEAINPILIVMGKTEAPSISKRIMGSNTNHVINETHFPIISIRGQNPIENTQLSDHCIVVPLDVTKEIKEQITVAIEIAKFFNSSIKIVSVFADSSAATETTLLTKLHKAQKMVESLGVKCSTKLITDSKTNIPKLVIDYATEEKAHLIAIMTQQETEFLDMFIGSTAKAILDQSPIHVLSVVPWNTNDGSKIFKAVYDPLNIFDK